MRITPTSEQMTYLVSIGVSKETLAQPGPGGSQQDNHKAARRSRGRIIIWCALVVIIVLLLAMAGPTSGQEPKSQGGVSIRGHRGPQGDHSLTQRLDAFEMEITRLHEAAGHAATGDRFLGHHRQLDESERRRDFRWVVILLAVIGIQGVGLIFMENRIRQVEQSTFSGLIEIATTTRVSPKKPALKSTTGIGTANKSTLHRKAGIEPERPRPIFLPTPVEQMKRIIDWAEKFRFMRIKPWVSSGPWKLGLATNQGKVRSENQDDGLCFQINRYYALIVADGCGGVPHGQRAAYLAVTSAAFSVVKALGLRRWRHSPDVKDMAANAIEAAAHRLAIEGDKLNITDVRGGLRTTLIVVIGNKREAGYAYIGDGGGSVVKSSGDVNRFLDPQKANDFAMNVLAASLGPKMEGEPVIGLLKRTPGDLLIVGTDGVFDRVDHEFPRDVLRGCIQYSGNLQKTAEHIVAELASFQDSAGYVCDDNLTLGIMGDGKTPKLTAGFWTRVKEAVAPPQLSLP